MCSYFGLRRLLGLGYGFCEGIDSISYGLLPFLVVVMSFGVFLLFRTKQIRRWRRDVCSPTEEGGIGMRKKTGEGDSYIYARYKIRRGKGLLRSWLGEPTAIIVTGRDWLTLTLVRAHLERIENFVGYPLGMPKLVRKKFFSKTHSFRIEVKRYVLTSRDIKSNKIKGI